MGDMIEAQGTDTAVACPECHSQTVRPSHSSYPLDRGRIGGSALSFWRCDNCGTRFLGPVVEEHHRSRKRRRGSTDPKDELGQKVRFGRWVKKWIFPTIAILLTILIVVYLLDRRITRPTGEEGVVISPG